MQIVSEAFERCGTKDGGPKLKDEKAWHAAFERKALLFTFYTIVGITKALIFKMLKILAQLFYRDSNVIKILVNGLSCVIHKKLSEPVLGKEGYVSAHAITLVTKGLVKAEKDVGEVRYVNENQLIFYLKTFTLFRISFRGKDSLKPLYFFSAKTSLQLLLMPLI